MHTCNNNYINEVDHLRSPILPTSTTTVTTSTTTTHVWLQLPDSQRQNADGNMSVLRLPPKRERSLLAGPHCGDPTGGRSPAGQVHKNAQGGQPAIFGFRLKGLYFTDLVWLSRVCELGGFGSGSGFGMNSSQISVETWRIRGGQHSAPPPRQVFRPHKESAI